MFEIVPSFLAHEIIDGLDSPRARQNVAQVSRDANRLVQQSDEAFYDAWLKSDFECDASSGQGQAKDQYRARLAENQEEVSRLLEMARLGKVGSLAANMSDMQNMHKLSNRYGKERVAQAGLRIVRGFAAPLRPFDSPPRLRAGELNELVDATRALHASAIRPVVTHGDFRGVLEMAAQDAACLVTRASEPQTKVPPAPRKRAPLQAWAGPH